MAVFSPHTLLHGCESWTLYARRKKKLREEGGRGGVGEGGLRWLQVHSVLHFLAIVCSDRVSNTEVLTHAGPQGMFTLLMLARARPP